MHYNVSLAQLVDCQTVDLEVPGSNPGLGEFVFLIPFNDEMNQMVKDKAKAKNKNNNSSNFLVFGRWPQTKM